LGFWWRRPRHSSGVSSLGVMVLVVGSEEDRMEIGAGMSLTSL